MRLFTSVYPFRSGDRLAEIRGCFENNVKVFDEMVVFAENCTTLDSSAYDFLSLPGVVVVPTRRRPTYKMFFDYANLRTRAGVDVIGNSDIEFDETARLAAERDLRDQLWSVSRYNEGPPGQWVLQGGGWEGSADSWFFQTPIKDFASDIQIGVLGCDSYLSQKAVEAGLRVANPCLSVVTKHRHRTTERDDSPGGLRYWNASDYGYHVIPPSAL